MKLCQIISGLCCAALLSISVVRSGLAASLSEIPFNLPSFVVAFKNYAAAQELSQLGKRDVVLIIDRSRSMLISDCCSGENINGAFFMPMSRWQWCHQQTLQLAKKTERVLPQGLTVVTFAKTFETYNNAEIGSIETLFANSKPDGGTDTAAALNSQIEAYFARKSQSPGQTKPMLIAIISDGCPDNAELFCHVIVKATQRMNQPGEISISFLQVGNDHRAIYLLKQLKNGLLDHNAKFNIVNIIAFPELNKIGLAKALIDAANPHLSSRIVI